MISSQPILIWPDLWALSILSHTLLDTLREMTGWFGLTMSKGRTASCQNTNHGQTKLTWYATTAYQKGRVRHKYCQQQATVCPMRCDGNEEEITDWQMEGKNIQNKGKNRQINKQIKSTYIAVFLYEMNHLSVGTCYGKPSQMMVKWCFGMPHGTSPE